MTDLSRCMACRGSDLKRVRPYRAESPGGQALFRGEVASCASCGLSQLAPLPLESDLTRYYTTEYRKGGRYGSDAADLARFPRDNLFFFNRGRSIAELVQRHRPAGRVLTRVLDVGAGYGHILHQVGEQSPGVALHAHEMSEPCVAHLRGIGVTVHQASLGEALAQSGGGFDLAILSHVLEHLRNPVETLGLLRSHLAPGGLLYVEVPHVPQGSLLTLDDNPWAPRHDEPHLSFFGPENLSDVLNRAGFRPLMIDTAGPLWHPIGALRYRLPPLMPTLRRLLPRGLMSRLRSTEASTTGDRWPDFYSYGGHRIWLRSLSTAV